MSELNKTDLKSEKITPPKSLKNFEDSEKIWEVISKKYPKVAPLLGVMESTLQTAEILLEQLQSPNNLGIAFSMDEAINVNFDDDSTRAASEIMDDEKSQCNTSNIFDSENFNINCPHSSESVFVAEKIDDEISFSEGRETNLMPCCLSYTKPNTNLLQDNLEIERNDIKGSPKNIESNNNLTESSSSSSKFEIEEVTEFVKFSKAQELTENLKIVQETTLIINKNSEDSEYVTQESIPYFKKMVETIKKNEETMLMTQRIETLKHDLESNEKLQEVVEILRSKDSETASIDEWDNVVGNLSISS